MKDQRQNIGFRLAEQRGVGSVRYSTGCVHRRRSRLVQSRKGQDRRKRDYTGCKCRGHIFRRTIAAIYGDEKNPKTIHDESNQAEVQQAIVLLREKGAKETSPMNQLKDKMLLSLLLWQIGDNKEARAEAHNAVDIANVWNNGRWTWYNYKVTPTLP